MRRIAGFYQLAIDWAGKNLPPRYNIAPTQDALVIRRHPETGQRSADMLRWGLLPGWAKDASGGARMINARAETVADKPSFRAAFAKRRCLVPADGFYEWQTLPRGARQPWLIARADGDLFSFAGLWEGWRAPDGTIVRSFTIITTEANAGLRPIHERMPVILPPEVYTAWLDPATPADDALAMLRPAPDDLLTAYRVSTRVNNVRNDDPECAAPVEPIAKKG